MPLHHHPVRHDSGFQVATEDPQHRLILDPLCQPPHQHVVVHPVEKLLQVHIHHPSSPFLDVLLRFAHRIVCSAPRPEAVAVPTERRVEPRLQHLQDGLLDEPVQHGRNPQLPDPSPTLRYLLPSYRLRLVGPRQQPLSDLPPVPAQVLWQLLHAHPVDARTALILPHAFQRSYEVGTPDHLLHQEMLAS